MSNRQRGKGELDDRTDLGDGHGLGEVLSAMRPILDTQRALSTLWLDIGAEAARHASLGVRLSLSRLGPGGNPGNIGAYLQLTTFAMDRYTAAGREIASAWMLDPQREAKRAGAGRE